MVERDQLRVIFPEGRFAHIVGSVWGSGNGKREPLVFPRSYSGGHLHIAYGLSA